MRVPCSSNSLSLGHDWVNASQNGQVVEDLVLDGRCLTEREVPDCLGRAIAPASVVTGSRPEFAFVARTVYGCILKQHASNHLCHREDRPLRPCFRLLRLPRHRGAPIQGAFITLPHRYLIDACDCQKGAALAMHHGLFLLLLTAMFEVANIGRPFLTPCPIQAWHSADLRPK